MKFKLGILIIGVCFFISAVWASRGSAPTGAKDSKGLQPYEEALAKMMMASQDSKVELSQLFDGIQNTNAASSDDKGPKNVNGNRCTDAFGQCNNNELNASTLIDAPCKYNQNTLVARATCTLASSDRQPEERKSEK